jgi:SanA protein
MKIAILAVGVVIALLSLSVCLSKWLRRRGDSRLLRSLDDAPETARIVVLGCPPRHQSGNANPYFIGRIASAAAAYHHTNTRRILCSGRGDDDEFDEAIAMVEALESASVPRAAIDLDQRSERTLDSIDHVAECHETETILLVTQPFHMSRVLYLARSRGLDAWGLIASGPVPGPRIRIREAMAELRAVLDLLFSRRRRSQAGESS